MGCAEDAALVERVRSGNREAFRPLVEQYAARVYRLCYALLRHRQDAEDAAQETFLRVYRALDRFDPEGSFANWTLKIAANACRDRLRRRRHDPGVVGGDFAEVAAPGPADAAGEPPVTLAELDAAVGALPPEYREVFHLRHREGLLCAEVAEVLDRPIGTIKTQLHRARLRLRDLVRSGRRREPAAGGEL